MSHYKYAFVSQNSIQKNQTQQLNKHHKNILEALSKIKWLDVLIILGGFYLSCSKMLYVNFSTKDERTTAIMQSSMALNKTKAKKIKISDVNENLMPSFQNSSIDTGIVEILPLRKPTIVNPKTSEGDIANLFTNVSPLFNKGINNGVDKSKKEKCTEYIARFVNVAKVEREKFGIPISITLAQGLLESDAGESALSRKANNHFGVKTFSARVPHVVLRDDTPHDKFKKYNSAWESYRDHSLLLVKNHYNQLQYLSKTDYVGWAKGLQRAGYATDAEYSKKLISLIENLKLFRLDEV